MASSTVRYKKLAVMVRNAYNERNQLQRIEDMEILMPALETLATDSKLKTFDPNKFIDETLADA